MAYLDTHYYGGIKKYQWVTIPLAIHGTIAKRRNSVTLLLGKKEDDPVLVISDLLIHLSQQQIEKKAGVVVEGEGLISSLQQSRLQAMQNWRKKKKSW